LSRMVT